MAGAAVAPALGLIQEYFADIDRSLVQMIVSMPALFIAGTNLFLFKPLCKRFRARTLLIIGLLLISAALYLAQFATPLILSAAGQLFSANSFVYALCAACVLAVVSITIHE